MQAKCTKGSEKTWKAHRIHCPCAGSHHHGCWSFTAPHLESGPALCDIPLQTWAGFLFLGHHRKIHNFQEVLLAIPVLILISWTWTGQERLVLLREASHKYGLELEAEMKQVETRRNWESYKMQEGSLPQLSCSSPQSLLSTSLKSQTPRDWWISDCDASQKWKTPDSH